MAPTSEVLRNATPGVEGVERKLAQRPSQWALVEPITLMALVWPHGRFSGRGRQEPHAARRTAPPLPLTSNPNTSGAFFFRTGRPASSPPLNAG